MTLIHRRFHIYKWLLRLALLVYLAVATLLLIRFVHNFSSFKEYIRRIMMFEDGAALLLYLLALIAGLIAHGFLQSFLNVRRDTLLRRSEAAAQQQAESARFAAMSERLTQSEAPAKEPETLPHEALLLWARTAAEYVPRPRRSAVYLELMDHLLQCAESTGSDEAAIAAMGDAHLVGRRLRREALSPTRLPGLLAATLRGRSWVTFYSGEDAEQFAQLHHSLSAAGVEFQSDELDAVTRGLSAVYGTLPPGMWGADTSVRRAGAPVSSVAGRIMTHATDYAKPTRYTLRIRRRDEPLARRLAR